MDRDKFYQIFSHYLLVLLSIGAHVLHTLAADDDVFNTKVQINPSSAEKGDFVEFRCDFTLVDEKDLHLLYWETTNGERLFTYNNDDGTSKKNPKFEDKIMNDQYIDNVEGGGEWDRQHILLMKVDNCDRATYRCLVLNKEVFNEGSDQQTLEITAHLPDPGICLKIDGKCHKVDVYRENMTTLTVTCKVTQSSVEPGMKLIKITKDTGEDGVEVETTPTIEHLDGCLHNGDLESGELVVEVDVETTFRCEVNYGGTDKSSEAAITFIRAGASSGASTGKSIGIAVGVVLIIVIIAVIVFVAYKKYKKDQQSRKYEAPKKSSPSEVKIIHPHTNDPANV